MDDIRHLAGSVVGARWRLDAYLASGGMSVIYSGTHLLTRLRAAIKILRPELFAEAVAWERFKREISAAAEIGHPGIVRVLDAGVDPALGGIHYVVMELLEGEDLRTRMEKGGVPREAALRIVDELLDALDAAHAAGFVHRDLKPENIFLARSADGGEHVKILDFGIARRDAVGDAPTPLDHQTRTATAIGTPAYMAPEQMRSARNASTRADVWSVGVIIHELIAGTLPFEGDDALGIMSAVLTSAPASLPPDVPAPLASLVRQCLDKDPARRPHGAGELRARIRETVGLDTRVSANAHEPRRVVAPTLVMGAPAPPGPSAPGPPAPPAASPVGRSTRDLGGWETWRYGAVGLVLFAAAGCLFYGEMLDARSDAPATDGHRGVPAARRQRPPSASAAPVEEDAAVLPTPRTEPTIAASGGRGATRRRSEDREAASQRSKTAPGRDMSQADGLTADQIRSVITRERPTINRCWADELSRADDLHAVDPWQAELQGSRGVRFDIELTIGGSGTVTDVGVRGGEPGELRECVIRNLRRWRFPPTPASTQVEFPLVFLVEE